MHNIRNLSGRNNEYYTCETLQTWFAKIELEIVKTNPDDVLAGLLTVLHDKGKMRKRIDHLAEELRLVVALSAQDWQVHSDYSVQIKIAIYKKAYDTLIAYSEPSSYPALHAFVVSRYIHFGQNHINYEKMREMATKSLQYFNLSSQFKYDKNIAIIDNQIWGCKRSNFFKLFEFIKMNPNLDVYYELVLQNILHYHNLYSISIYDNVKKLHWLILNLLTKTNACIANNTNRKHFDAKIMESMINGGLVTLLNLFHFLRKSDKDKRDTTGMIDADLVLNHVAQCFEILFNCYMFSENSICKLYRHEFCERAILCAKKKLKIHSNDKNKYNQTDIKCEKILNDLHDLMRIYFIVGDWDSLKRCAKLRSIHPNFKPELLDIAAEYLDNDDDEPIKTYKKLEVFWKYAFIKSEVGDKFEDFHKQRNAISDIVEYLHAIKNLGKKRTKIENENRPLKLKLPFNKENIYKILGKQENQRTLRNIVTLQQCNWYKCMKKDIKLKKCRQCMSVFYCSKLCQKKDWKMHKKCCTVSKKRDYSITFNIN